MEQLFGVELHSKANDFIRLTMKMKNGRTKILENQGFRTCRFYFIKKYIWEMVVKLATISDCIFGDKRWTEPNKYGKISIRNDALKSRVDGE